LSRCVSSICTIDVLVSVGTCSHAKIICPSMKTDVHDPFGEKGSCLERKIAHVSLKHNKKEAQPQEFFQGRQLAHLVAQSVGSSLTNVITICKRKILKYLNFDVILLIDQLQIKYL
jgi:hypothetical protein